MMHWFVSNGKGPVVVLISWNQSMTYFPSQNGRAEQREERLLWRTIINVSSKPLSLSLSLFLSSPLLSSPLLSSLSLSLSLFAMLEVTHMTLCSGPQSIAIRPPREADALYIYTFSSSEEWSSWFNDIQALIDEYFANVSFLYWSSPSPSLSVSLCLSLSLSLSLSVPIADSN